MGARLRQRYARHGRGVRVLTVVDTFTREWLGLDVDTSLSSRRVTRKLDQIIEERGMPESIRCDNGPELTSRHILGWCTDNKINPIHIQPGKPMQKRARGKLQRQVPR
jgi:putative transposase